MTSRGLAGLGLGAISALLLTAPNASALTKATAQGIDLGDSAYRATAECGPRQRVVSGGFRTNSGAYAVANKAIGKKEWRVKVLDATELTAYAFCTSRTVWARWGFSARAGATVVSSEDPGAAAKARCRGGKQAIAGGWRLSPLTVELGNNSPVYTSRPRGDRKWVVKAFSDNDEGETDRLTAFVYCIEDEVDVKVRSARRGPIDDNEDGRAKAHCKPGEELLGGGFATTPRSDFDNIDGPDLFYYRAFRSGRRTWLAAAHNYGQPGTITAFATCRA